MAFHHSPKIITDGLVLNLDAGDKNSYIGSGTTWSDLSGNGNNATMNAAAIGTDVPGSMDFNGSSEYLTVTNSTSLQIAANITYEWWFKTTSTSGEDWFFSNNIGSTPLIMSSIDNSGVIQFQFTDDDGTAVSGNYTDTATLTGWHHIALVCAGTTATLYTDTVQKITDTDGSFDTITLTTDFEIARDTRVARYFAGFMDIFRIYNKALSTKEISQNFNAQRHRFGV